MRNIVSIQYKSIIISSGRKKAITLFKKGWVHCFSIQVVINKCFLLNPEKKKFGANRLVVFKI